MKAKLPDNFFIYASQFSIKSMIMAISTIAFSIYNNPDKDLRSFAGIRNYSVTVNGKVFNNQITVVQTWLIDAIYDLVSSNINGEKMISIDEALHLLYLHEKYVDGKSRLRHINGVPSHTELFMEIYGFFGEQKRFEEQHKMFEEFSREKYILENVSSKETIMDYTGISFFDEFFETTGLTTDMYSAIILVIYGYFVKKTPVLNIHSVEQEFSLINLEKSEIIKILEKYACSIQELATNSLKRQLLYSKPIIKINNIYIASNPFLLLSLFVNSNYWVMRDKYKGLEDNKQKFVNAFGIYFEEYCKEILQNCLPDGSFHKIEEREEKRADWHISLSGFDFLVEQKSALSILSTKQNETDIESMKNHILRNWGKAVVQLDNTEKSLELENAFKIILVYEDYYKCESLDLLFELNPELKELDNKKYWLVTINEFEMLMYLFRKNENLFLEIIKEKDMLETTASNKGRDLTMIFNKHGIHNNDYIRDCGIYDLFDKIINLIKGS